MLKAFFTLLCFLLVCHTGICQSRFVTVKDRQFIVNSKPYYYIGANYWYAGLLALQKDPQRGKQRLRKELDFLKSKGVTNLRVLAGSEGSGLVNGVQRVEPSLQPEHGIYNNEVLEGLDYLLSEMGKRNMYAILFLSNNWEWSGGFLQYLGWNNVISDSTMRSKMSWDRLQDVTTKFYTCQPCKTDYRKQLELIVNRVNKYTKRPYRDEPAIMAWELANEPRPMRPAALNEYEKWTSEIAAYIKQLDKNHLVTLGTEGSMGTENAQVFKRIHSPVQVDYLTIHIWPKNWSWFRDTSIVRGMSQVLANTNSYIKTHEAIARELNKPLVIEEFGLPRDRHSFNIASSTSSRDNYYDSIFAIWDASRQQNGSIAGCNFWAYSGIALPIPGQLFWKKGDDFMGDPPQEEQGLNSVFNTDYSTWKIIERYTRAKK